MATVADLEATPEDMNRYEVIDGVIFVSEWPGVTHQLVSMRLTVLFLRYLERDSIGEVIAIPVVTFSEDDSVMPDLVFIRSERASEVISDDRIVAAPDLIVEILSPGPENRRRDCIVKKRLYARFGIEEYWILDPPTKSIEIYVLKDGSLASWATLGVDDRIRSVVLPGLNSPVSSIFVG